MIIGEAIGVSGPAVILSFSLAGLTCVFSALAFAELASMIPVPRIIAPVAPSGWPMAIAPPLTLTFSMSTRKVVVLGAGMMGAGIAYQCAKSGIGATNAGAAKMRERVIALRRERSRVPAMPSLLLSTGRAP